jgi:YtfJ family uncharacterized protein
MRGEIMKSVRWPSLALAASAAMLFQSSVFAVEQPETGFVGTHPGLMPGQSLPVLDIQVGGEIHISDRDIIKRPWNSTSFDSKGKVQLVQYVAANFGVRGQNKTFTDTLVKKRFTSEQLSTTVIVNMADTMELAKGMVMKKVAKNKAKHQTNDFIIDDNGVGLQSWGMKNKSYAIIVLDADGKILFAKDGPLSEIEIESAIELIEKQMI